MSDERKLISVEIGRGLNVDSFQEDNPGVSDCQNVEPLPSGQGLYGRRGYAIYNRYAPVLTGANLNRVALVVDTQLPNLSDGTWGCFAVDTSNNNAIIAGELFKQRTNLPGDTSASVVSFAAAVYRTTPGATLTITVTRVGALDRTVTVTYTTSNDTASAGTDYTAATGTLTFSGGETTKTFDVTILNSSPTAIETFLVSLSNPTAGATIGNPNPTVVQIVANFVVSAYNIDGFNVLRMYLYNKDANRFTGFRLNFTSGSTLTSTGYGKQLARVSQDVIMYVYGGSETATATDPGLLRVHLFYIPKLLSDGGSYQPPNSNTANTASVIITIPCIVRDVTKFRIIPWTQDRCVIMGCRQSWVINLTTGTLEKTYSNPVISTGQSEWVETQATARPFFDTNGYLVTFVTTIDASTVNRLVRIDPNTWQLNTSYAVGATIGCMAPLSLGGSCYFLSGNIYRVSADLQTHTNCGALAAPRQNIIMSGPSDSIYFVQEAAASEHKKYTVNASTVTLNTTYTNWDWDDGVVQLGIFDSTSFFIRDIVSSVATFMVMNNDFTVATRHRISTASDTTPVVITTAAAHGLENGDVVAVKNVSGSTTANGVWTVANKTPTTFELATSTAGGSGTGGSVSMKEVDQYNAAFYGSTMTMPYDNLDVMCWQVNNITGTVS